MFDMDEYLNYTGIFCAAILHPKSEKLIRDICRSSNIIEPYEMHCTIFCSTNDNLNFKCISNYNQPIIVDVVGYRIFDSKILVIEVESSDLRSKHTQYLNSFNLNHTHNEYIPHITVSHDFHGDISELPDIKNLRIELIGEYAVASLIKE